MVALGGAGKTVPHLHRKAHIMPRSLIRGDYSLLMAVESSSRPNSWYRVLADRQTGLLSCDCPIWLFNRQADEQGNRACQHTIVTSRLAATNQTAVTQAR